MSSRRDRYYLLLILSVALITRLGLLIAVHGRDIADLFPDSQTYLEPAKNLLKMGAFYQGDVAKGQPEIIRTPGYPLFLLFCGLRNNNRYGFTQLVQVGLDVATVFLTYLLGARIVDRTVGLWAAGFQSISVGCVTASVFILSECLFLFLFTIALLLLVRRLEEESRWAILLSAVIMAAATYVRPIGMVFIPVALLALLCASRRAWLRASMRAAEFGLIFAALIAPWYLRNHAVGYDGFSAITDKNLMEYEAPAVLASTENIPVGAAMKEFDDLLAPRIEEAGVRRGSGPAMKLGGDMAKWIIFTHPLVWFRVHMVTSLNAMLPASTGLLEALGITSGNKGTLAVLQNQGLAAAAKIYFGGNIWAFLLTIPELLFQAIQYGLCMVFAFVTIRRRGLDWGCVGWLMALTVTAFIFVAGPAATPRFREPVEPLLNIAAAAGLMHMAGNRRHPA